MDWITVKILWNNTASHFRKKVAVGLTRNQDRKVSPIGAPMRLLLAFLAIGFSLLSMPAQAESKIYGKVVGVTDGDTITVLTPMKEQIKVRLAEIDAPEKDQPYGQASKKFLSAMVFDKEVTLLVQVKDRYGRTVARVYVGPTDVNLQLVKNGVAWAYRKYLKDTALLEAENEARKAKVGLWGLQEDQIMAPWEWRRNR